MRMYIPALLSPHHNTRATLKHRINTLSRSPLRAQPRSGFKRTDFNFVQKPIRFAESYCKRQQPDIVACELGIRDIPGSSSHSTGTLK